MTLKTSLNATIERRCHCQFDDKSRFWSLAVGNWVIVWVYVLFHHSVWLIPWLFSIHRLEKGVCQHFERWFFAIHRVWWKSDKWSMSIMNSKSVIKYIAIEWNSFCVSSVSLTCRLRLGKSVNMNIKENVIEQKCIPWLNFQWRRLQRIRRIWWRSTNHRSRSRKRIKSCLYRLRHPRPWMDLTSILPMVHQRSNHWSICQLQEWYQIFDSTTSQPRRICLFLDWKQNVEKEQS